MARHIIRIAESKSELVFGSLPPDDPKVRRPDITLAQRVLDGWAPRVPIEDGLRRTHAYFKEALERESRGAT
jgi:nucleoside-diphosphate-sugar epimerase